jgi:hypothetical protein
MFGDISAIPVVGVYVTHWLWGVVLSFLQPSPPPPSPPPPSPPPYPPAEFSDRVYVSMLFRDLDIQEWTAVSDRIFKKVNLFCCTGISMSIMIIRIIRIQTWKRPNPSND